MTRIKVIERATNLEMMAEAIEGGYQVYTMDGEKYKKLRTSTFKKYFKATGDTVNQKEAPKAEPISEEKRQKMVEKVKKMMELANNNPSEEEALAAALHAHKLMAKYNIHKDEVELEEVKEDIVSVFSEQKHNSSLHKWRKQLGAVVAKAFRCKCYIHGQDVVFRGYKNDAELALDVYLMLYTTGDKLGSKEYHKQIQETGTGRGAYNSFVLGFLHGVKSALDEQCTALMVITPQEVEEDWKDFSANMRTSKSNIRLTDSELFNKGFAEGKQAVKSRAIEG